MPPIERLYLKNFRNHTELRLDFTAKKVVLAGDNGKGKTNLLESLYFLSILRSFRTSNLRTLPAIGSSSFEIQALLSDGANPAHRLYLSQEAKKRRLSIDGEPLKKSSDFIRKFRAVPFAPEDLDILGGASGMRRRFFDMLSSVLDNHYRLALKDYLHSLSLCNAALKTGAPEPVVSAFHEVMAQCFPAISAGRRKYSLLMESEMRRLLSLEESDFSIVYKPDVSEEKIPFRDRLRRDFENDRRRGFVSCGPQNDEFEFFYLQRPLRNYGSTGQLRKNALFLKLAELNLLRRLGGENCPVIALVDDVSGELDSVNRCNFFQALSCADQIFFTYTAIPQDSYFSDAQNILL